MFKLQQQHSLSNLDFGCMLAAAPSTIQNFQRVVFFCFAAPHKREPSGIDSSRLNLNLSPLLCSAALCSCTHCSDAGNPR